MKGADQNFQVKRFQRLNRFHLCLCLAAGSLKVLLAGGDLADESGDDVGDDLTDERVDVPLGNVIAHLHLLLLLLLLVRANCLLIAAGHQVKLNSLFEPDSAALDLAGSHNSIENVDCEGYLLVRFALLTVDNL